MQPFTAAATFRVGAMTLDRGVRFSGETNELSDADFNTMRQYHLLYGYFCFKPNEYQESDIPKGNADLKGKSQSERIRNSLFVLNQVQGGTKENFNGFYQVETEKFITNIKRRIEEITGPGF